MANTTLDDAMVVKLQSQDIEAFEPKEAIKGWVVSWTLRSEGISTSSLTPTNSSH